MWLAVVQKDLSGGSECRQDSKSQVKLWSTNIAGSLIKLVQIFNSIQSCKDIVTRPSTPPLSK